MRNKCYLAFMMMFLLVGTTFYSSFAIAISSGFTTTSGASSVSYQSQPSFQTYYSSSAGTGLGTRLQTYWPILGNAAQCEARQDLLLNVAPFGCEPAIVRSDLLAEQNVPVFCQIDATKINPLIDIDQINNIEFVGNKPAEVVGFGFHPAKAALRTSNTLLGSPLVNNIGYVVVVLKQQPDESKLPNNITLSLSARVDYIAGNAYGVGRSEFILRSVSNEQEWENEKLKQSFWNGRYFVRLEEADSNYVVVSIYEGDRKIVTQRIERGKTSGKIFVPGMYCRAGLDITYSDFVSADKTAKIEVSSGNGYDVFEVSEGSRFMDDRCTVSTITLDENGETGKVEGVCSSKKFVLQLKPKGAAQFSAFLANGTLHEPTKRDEAGAYQVDLMQLNDSRKGIYILDENDGLSKLDSKGKAILILSKDGTFGSGVSSAEKDWLLKLREALVEYKRVSGVEGFKFNQLGEGVASADVRKYFNDAIANYEKVADDYTNEKEQDTEQGRVYGKMALEEAINLAGVLNMDSAKAGLINKYLSLYNDSGSSANYVSELNKLYKIDSTLAGEVIEFEDKARTLRLVELNEPKTKPNAIFNIEGKDVSIDKGDKVNINHGGDKKGELILDNVQPEKISVSSYCKEANGNLSSKRNMYDLKIGGNQNICDVSVSLKKINTENVVKIKITPSAEGTQTLTNFSVNIGIEKRAIKLNPDKTQEKIDELNKTIQKWEKISDSLGKVVTGLKTACFATSAVLTFKNFFTGLSGETLARQEVMGGDNGWRNQCRNEVAAGKYSTLDACYLSNSGKIDADVAKVSAAINNVNNKIEPIQNSETVSKDIFGKSVNSDNVRKKLANQIKQDYSGLEIDMGNKPWINETGGSVSKVKVEDVLTDRAVEKGLVTTEQMRSLMLQAELQKTGGLSSGQVVNANSNLKEVASQINANMIIDRDQQKREQNKAKGLGETFYDANLNKRYVDIVPAGNLANIYTGFGGDVTSSATYMSSGQKYVLGLSKVDSTKDYYVVKKVWKEGASAPLNESETQTFANKIGTLIPQGNLNYNNEIVAQDRVVKYYETEPYKGMPAVVPFDVQKGWYAATKQTLPVFGGIGAFDSSGKVTSFWVCNVGQNGRVEFETGLGDDLCQQVNLNTGQPLGVFPNLDTSQAQNLVSKAIKAIEDAAKQYGNKFVTVNGERMQSTISVGQAGTQCQDFMSPKDCLLLFNVCDPVICPSSRCNLGGLYPVANVVQQGIIGSLLLCLPNIREGVAIPICLTGVKAGIDGLLSIMKNYRSCLQENLETGRMVGICDEIYSIYLCDFFWGQIAPVVDVLIPKLIETAYGQGVRGGAEYLTVNAAWQNMENSINYFTNTYAVNSMTAFQARTGGKFGSAPLQSAVISEIGGQFCDSFVSMKAPTELSSLVEPDSPPQFHAWFDERKFTDATVPATSQYKVFYHIYAGNDQGIQFSVYLRNPPQSPYYATAQEVQVASDYVPKGEFASNTKDFTAPAGYKELCVRINNDVQCGFGQVSTSFAINSLRDAYVSDEITNKNIQSEKECISGSSNAGALLNPNIQSGVEEVVSPSIYNRGVVRICSTTNPGLGTDPGRFVQVGICDDSKIGCWIDSRSVENAITSNNLLAKNQTLTELQNSTIETLIMNGELLNADQANAEIKSLDNAIAEIQNSQDPKIAAKDILARADVISGKLIFNYHKAWLLLVKGRVNAEVARLLWNVEMANRSKERGVTTIQGTTTSEQSQNESVQIIAENGVTNVTQNVTAEEAQTNVTSGATNETQNITSTESGQQQANENISTLNLPGATELYYKYNSVWQWSPDKINWMNVPNTFVVGGSWSGQKPALNNIRIIRELSGKNLEKGQSILGDAKNGIISKWTLEFAIDELKTRAGTYSSNKDFIDKIYNDGLLTDEEYVDINGEGFWNVEENMNFVLSLLQKKLATTINACGTGENLQYCGSTDCNSIGGGLWNGGECSLKDSYKANGRESLQDIADKLCNGDTTMIVKTNKDNQPFVDIINGGIDFQGDYWPTGVKIDLSNC